MLTTFSISVRNSLLPLVIALSVAACSDAGAPRSGVEGAVEDPAPPIPSIVDDRHSLANISIGRVEPTTAPAPAARRDSNADGVSMPEGFSALINFAREAAGKDTDMALDAIERARHLRPESVLPDIEAARVLLAVERVEEAKGFAEQAVDADPLSSYAWNTMGRVYLGEGDDDGAVRAFERAVEENEDNSYAWNNLGLALFRLDRYPEATEALERATSAAKPTHYMWNNLGMSYEHLGRSDLALAAYRQAVDSGSSRATENLERLIATGYGAESDGTIVSELP